MITAAAHDDQTTNYTYDYDSVGNLIRHANGTVTHNYTYDDADWADLLTAFDGQKITYKAGNPISYYNGTRWTFGWKNGRQLSSASSAEHDISYTYDGSGLRTSKTVDGVRHNYIYGEGRILKEYTSDYALYFFYNADGTPYGCYYKPTNGGGANYYYVTNLQGDVTHLIDSSSKIVASYEYDPYGKVLKASGTMAQINPLRYRGYYYDTESELYYLQSRYYDPVTCRFINADSYSSTGQGILGNNMFAYCLNNPIGCCDSGGYWTISLSGTASGYFGIGISLSLGIVFDDKGNIDIQFTYAIPGINDTSAFGGLAVGVGGAVQVTTANTVYDLCGLSSCHGVGAGPSWYVGADILSFSDASDLDSFEGVQISAGVRLGIDAHATNSDTVSLINYGGDKGPTSNHHPKPYRKYTWTYQIN